VHGSADVVVSLALGPNFRDRESVRTEGLFRGEWPHAAAAPVEN
jgi:hypothetical protein